VAQNFFYLALSLLRSAHREVASEHEKRGREAIRFVKP
jgi:hypothetical protein